MTTQHSFHLFDLCAFCFLVFGFASLAVWFGWIREYVQSHGERTGSLLWGGAWITDYATAMRIAKHESRVPWFLRLFQIMMSLGLLFFIVGIISLALSQ
jgi:hypothetical protein